ncbi:MAG TPA: hypothetical protein IAB35_00890, partial [Candidatus Faecimonas gallistercoris]|nr:hypothetical protein [Candidatus Faecimonas gallistercoris]
SDLGYVRPRNMSYLCDIYSHHVLKGQNYREDVKIIQINFSYGLTDDEALRIYYVQDKEKKKYVENFIIYEINMEKYKSFWYTNDVQQIEKNKEIIMLDLELEELKSLSKKDRMVERFMEEVKRVNEDPDFHVYMSVEEDNRKIENSIREEMIEKGLKEGLEKGMEKGVKQGKKDANKQVVIAMLEQGLDVNTISKYTKLDLYFVKKCQESISNH